MLKNKFLEISLGITLSGWYLIYPQLFFPSSQAQPVQVLDSAPYSSWGWASSFDTARECTLEMTKALSYPHPHQPYLGYEKAVSQQSMEGKCISSDDPRLKP